MTSIEGSTGWRTLKQKLSFKGLGCCGALWSPTRAPITILDHPQQHQEEQEERQPMMLMMMMMQETHQEPLTPLGCDNFRGDEEDGRGLRRSNNGGGNMVGPGSSASSGMNLAMALAAERNLRLGPNNIDGGGAQQCKTLMRLIEETDGVDFRKSRRTGGGADEKSESDWVCCVCMERSKGAAFIPCGHTYCRVCARELWINRGSCPICNRTILEILDIF